MQNSHLSRYTSYMLTPLTVFNMKEKLIVLLLGVHLVIVYMGSNLFNLGCLPLRVQSTLSVYCSMVGAIQYNFFAVNITTQPIAKCYILDSDNEIKSEVFGEEQGSYEFKMGMPFEVFYSEHAHELTARLAAAYCYKVYPHAQVVKVCLGQYQVPTVNEFNKGKRCTFSEYYNGTYLHE